MINSNAPKSCERRLSSARFRYASPLNTGKPILTVGIIRRKTQRSTETGMWLTSGVCGFEGRRQSLSVATSSLQAGRTVSSYPKLVLRRTAHATNNGSIAAARSNHEMADA